jgi:hypothetical protein
MDDLKKEVFEKAHTKDSSELARKYFSLCSLKLKDVTKEKCEILRNFIKKEMYILLADDSYNMINDFCMDARIRKDKHGIYLYANGSYFTRREAISFYFEEEYIGFCGWASGCNRIPFIIGFIKWCDWLEEKKHE